MITIFFESDGHVFESATFANEGLYIACYGALEHYARLNNFDMTEVVT